MIIEEIKKLVKKTEEKRTGKIIIIKMYSSDMDGVDEQVRKLLKKNKVQYKEAMFAGLSKSRKGFEIKGDITYRIVGKPAKFGTGAPVNLKPQAFGIEGETPHSNVNAYVKKVLEGIDKNKKIPGNVKEYITALVKFWDGDKSQAKILQELYKAGQPVQEINKDFGEVLGPIAIIRNQMLKQKAKQTLSPGTKIYVPARPNEPLMDYQLIDRNNYVISAKSGKVTNTVKPADVIGLLKKDKAAFAKYKNTPEFKVLEMLGEGSIIGGPLKAVAALKLMPISMEAAEEIEKKKNNYDETKVFEYITTNDYLKKVKGKPLASELAREAEKIIVNLSRSKWNFTPLFEAAIHLKVIYVKFELTTNGQGKFEIIVSNDFRNNKVQLRSKNSYKSMKDRIGIQP